MDPISRRSTNSSDLSNKQIFFAYRNWVKYYAHRNCDHLVRPFLSDQISSAPPTGSWAKTMRQSHLYSMETIARKMEISRMTYCGLEKSEKAGTITIASLRRIAMAMDCELVYGFRPTNRQPLSETIWTKLCQHLSELQAQDHPPFRAKRLRRIKNSKMLSSTIRDLMNDPEARRKLGWTERKQDGKEI